MPEIAAAKITETVCALCRQANYELGDDVLEALDHALSIEESENGRETIRELISNAAIAKKEKLPICQDTGLVVVFVELGQEVKITGGTLDEAVNEGVSRAYKDLRKSVVNDPFIRENTNDNTPAIVHLSLVTGDRIKIGVLPKGGGAENASSLKMFLPTASKEEVIKYVVDCVRTSGPKACPPLIVGIGIGGNFDHCAYLAKKALTRRVKQNHSNHDIAQMEKRLLEEINRTGIGPMGLGGRVTALAVHIETHPCHIAALPVAVNMECHAHRHREATI
ncbi:MAG TPA: fumarate hydratase [Candidatus Omnitrophota bacterium]|nr:fumarate hydratase [Candidatus Omnitrophota bacterium]